MVVALPTMSGHGENIFLIGPMGSGKTSIGRRVARRLGLDFHDCDLELENRTGVPVSLIFDIEGEKGFRTRESALLRELASGRGRLVSTGGGIILTAQNRECMKENGLVVYLKTSVDQQLRRLERDRQRPLLQTSDRRERLEALARERNPVYESLADLIIVSENRSLRRMTRKVCRAIARVQEQHEAP